MTLAKPQLILISIAGFVILLLVLVFTGIIPGLQDKNPTQTVKAELQFWGIFDAVQKYDDAFNNFKKTYPGVTIKYRGFDTPEEYETAVLEALAAGRGPDVFMIPNTDLFRHLNKIIPVPPKTKNNSVDFSILKVRQLFPKTVEQDFTFKGDVYGLPLSIDTLALIYNRDFLNQAGVPLPPENWDDFKNLMPKLVKKDQNKNILKAGAAIGGSNQNINEATDLLYALMLQFLEPTNKKMVSQDLKSASFATKEGADALGFYTSFADPKNEFYTWNGSLSNSLDAFAEGKIGIIFDYAAIIPEIKERNPFLDVLIAPFPQQKESPQIINYPSYWGYVVSRQSKYQTIAWQFIINLTTDLGNAKGYVEKTKKPPALLSLINQNLNDPNLNVFARQALTARSWPKIDSIAVDRIFSETIESVITNQVKTGDALRNAQNQVTELMKKRIF